MSFPLFSRVILTQDFSDESLLVGDMGVVVEYHPATHDYPEGYEVEFFAGNGETVSVVSVPATALRSAVRTDILHARSQLAAAA